MKMIVESGATKSNWVLLDNDVVVSTQKFAGINVTSNPRSLAVVDQVNTAQLNHLDSIHFYGAGTRSLESKEKLAAKLNAHFQVENIFIETDIFAASLAASYSKPSIVSILGTGTNTVVYDGQSVIHKTKSMGYLISEPGSGFHIGQLILKAYLSDTMNASDAALLEKDFLPKEKDLLPHLYASAKPNFEMAQFTKFLEVCNPAFKAKILDQSFNAFFEERINRLKTFKEYKLTFVGSVAQVFRTELQEVAQKHKREIVNIIGDPLEGLIEYHKLN